MLQLFNVEPTQTCVAQILLAHGAGAGKASDFMQQMGSRLAAHGCRVWLFDFPYMQKIAAEGKKRPPDRADKLLDAFAEAIGEVFASADYDAALPFAIGGKSMGGRMATLLLSEYQDASDLQSKISHCVVLGYPFHPPGKPEKLRTSHFDGLQTPCLIIQGERDTFGGRHLIDSLTLPATFDLVLCNDGDHSFKPRKASGLTQDEHLEFAATTIQQWIQK